MADITTPSNNSSSHTQALTQAQAPRSMPVREDCWSEEATATLIEAWGQRYLDLNRGNLRQKQWQEVADTVNSRHGHNKKARRTDVQCKNRIDTLKKKYKIEKSRVLETNSVYVSSWLFFASLDRLIGNCVSAVKKTPSLNPSPTPSLTPVSGSLCYSMMNNNNGSGSGSGNGGVNVNTPVLAQKRPLGAEDFRRNYAAVAAAAAREEEESEEEEEEEEVERESEDGEEEEEEGEGEDGIRKLARVIEKFGEVYARVEREKQKQLIELEKQRMEFAKEMECQRMQMLVEMQVQLEKFKRAKRSHSDIWSWKVAEVSCRQVTEQHEYFYRTDEVLFAVENVFSFRMNVYSVDCGCIEEKHKNFKPNERTQKKLGVQKYLRMTQVLLKSHFREDFKSQSLADCNGIEVSVLVQVLNEKNLERPVFVKYMLKSHASSTFLLRIPLPFSRRYLPRKDLIMTLETESGKIYETKYLSEPAVFSGGWKRFAIAEKLVQGDHVVFHLVDVTRFKVYVIKKGSSMVKLPSHLLNLCKLARCGANDNQLIVYERRKMHQSVDTVDKTFGDEHCGKTGEINDRTRFNDFNINISTLLQDHELSEQSLHAYYELCHAQKAFLHAHLLEGVNPKLLVGVTRSTISNTIRIGIALRTCSLSTFLDNFSEWNKNLKHYEALGMNVSLLRARLDHLSNLAVTSDGAVSRDKYIEACRERPRCECEVKKLEMILAKLRKFSVMLDTKVQVLESESGWENYTEAYFRRTQVKDEIREIEGLIAGFKKFFEQYDVVIVALKSMLSSHERQFEEEAGAPW